MYRTPIWFDAETNPLFVDIVATRNLGDMSIVTIEYQYEDIGFMVAQRTIIIPTHLVIGLN